MKKTYKIEVDCAICAEKCALAAKKVKGVTDCNINFITQKMILEADDVDAVINDVIKACKKVEHDFEVIE